MNKYSFTEDGMTYVRRLACIGLMAVLSACSKDPEPAATADTAAAPPPAQVSQPALPAAPDPTDKMARAVGNGKPGAAVDIKYEFASRPEVGKAVELSIALIPSAGVDSMNATIGGMDGITLAGSLSASFSTVKAGEPYRHSVSVLANRNGVFYITVSVDTQIGGATLGRTFAIPFVAGASVAEEKPAVPAVKDATGQAVQPMKAQETTR